VTYAAGIVDEATLEKMEEPRCGNTERPTLEILPGGRHKRFAYNGKMIYN